MAVSLQDKKKYDQGNLPTALNVLADNNCIANLYTVSGPKLQNLFRSLLS